LIQTAGEDKELERLLLAEGHRIHYLPDINVYDEKVQNQANFSRQRRRWLSAQFYSALDMASHLTWNINYLDKFIQQLLIPRSMLLALVTLMSLLTLGERWLALALVLFTTLLIAIPRRLLNRRLLRALVHIPDHTLSFAMNIFKIKGQKDKFHHTEHVE
ncbi:MAG: glycosyltransferase family 2 protein, partial [Bacteroidaceae bacterium]|nr:glycosyltransferase family 2 protein [Bacteroidaceae bacterium]